MLEVHRTHRATIRNHSQVADSLDRHGWAASKLWNVANYYSRERWNETGEIPDHEELKSELKKHPKYKGLHSQSSQRVLEELAEAFNSWYSSDDGRDNPPGYRKQNYYDDEGNLVHEEHPRSTVTWKQKGFRHDKKHNRVRLSKGANHKEHPRAREYILVEYKTRPDVEVENIQQVRAVYDQAEERWGLHLVCTKEVETPNPPGDETAGIDLGISNFATVAYSTEDADLYPGNRLKQDGYYFPKEIAKCDDSDGERATRLHHKWSERRTHFFHALAKHIVQRCVEKGVGRINVGDLSGVREDDGETKNWGRHGNLDLHGWAFDRFTSILEYKAKVEGIELEEVDEEDTSKTCCVCGKADDSQRVERGLYVCEDCGSTFNADVNGAENIRRDINKTESNSESSASLDGDRSTGWLAQPGVYLYDLSCGFLPQTEVVDFKP